MTLLKFLGKKHYDIYWTLDPETRLIVRIAIRRVVDSLLETPPATMTVAELFATSAEMLNEFKRDDELEVPNDIEAIREKNLELLDEVDELREREDF